MNSRTGSRSGFAWKRVLKTLVAAAACSATAAALADAREQAIRIHDRIAGVPPTKEVLDRMTLMIENGDARGAALEATEDRLAVLERIVTDSGYRLGQEIERLRDETGKVQ